MSVGVSYHVASNESNKIYYDVNRLIIQGG